MNDLGSITNQMNAAYASQPASTGSENLSQTDFLRLMIAQLRSQDPSQPMDPTSFFNQISQFSMVSGMQGLQSSFASLAQSIQGSQALGGVDLIGHDVLIESAQGVLDDDGLQGAVEAPAGTTSISVRITNADGVLVRTMEIPAPTSGSNRFSWDGMDASVNAMPPGAYAIEATATVNGERVSAPTQASARVLGLIPGSGGGQPLLDLGPLGRIALSQIIQIV